MDPNWRQSRILKKAKVRFYFRTGPYYASYILIYTFLRID